VFQPRPARVIETLFVRVPKQIGSVPRLSYRQTSGAESHARREHVSHKSVGTLILEDFLKISVRMIAAWYTLFEAGRVLTGARTVDSSGDPNG
jgi:hypothetical protein